MLRSGATLPVRAELQACIYPSRLENMETTLVSFILALSPPTVPDSPETALVLVVPGNCLFLGPFTTVPPSLVSRWHRPPSRLLCATATEVPSRL